MGTSSSKRKNKTNTKNARNADKKLAMHEIEDHSAESKTKASVIKWDLSNYQPKAAENTEWDIFISHRQLNGGDQCHALFEHLKHSQAVRVWYDMDAERLNMTGMEEGVRDSKYVLVFVTDGIFDRPFCLMEISWAIKYNKPIIMMRETDPRHGGMSFDAFEKQVPVDLRGTLGEGEWLKYDRRGDWFNATITMLLKRCSIAPVPEATRDIFADASRGSTVTPNLLGSQYQPGTRQWLFDAVHEWHTSRQGGVGSQVFTLAGLSGVGKSVFASALCLRGNKDFDEYQAGSMPIVAFHFFRHDVVTDRSARQALLSIASQLRRSVPGFAAALLKIDLDPAGLRETWSLKEVFDNVIAKPAGMVKISDSVIVVIDALDECSEAAVFCQLLQQSWTAQTLPKWLGLFITSRPEYQDGWPTEVSKINAEDLRNTDDIASFLRIKLRDDAESAEDLEGMIAKLLQLSEGLFLYMRFLDVLLDEARQRRRASLVRLRKSSPNSTRQAKRASTNDPIKLTASDFFDFPKGMGGALAEFFQRLSVTLGHENYGLVLAPVANAREPLPMLLWMRCVKFDKYRGTANGRHDKKAVEGFASIRQHCRSLLVETEDPITRTHTVRFVHKSMSDWLTGGATDMHDTASKQGYNHLSVSLDEQGHVALSKQMMLLSKEQGGNAMVEAALSFTARHQFYHLCKIENFAQAASILFDLKKLLLWLEAAGVDNVLKDIADQLVLNEAARDQQELMVKQAAIITNVLRLGVVGIGEDSRALAGQIVGRLSVEDVASKNMKLVKQLRDQAWIYKPTPELDGTAVRWVRPLMPCLESAMPSPLLRIMHGHTNDVHVVAYSPDGKTIASGCQDNSIRLWDAHTGEAKFGGNALIGHTRPVYSVAFSSNGKTLASCGVDKTIRLWDVETGNAKLDGKPIEGHTRPVHAVVFTRDRKTIVSSGADNTIRIWDAKTGKAKLGGKPLEGHTGLVHSVVCTYDNKTIVSGSADKTIRLWDIKTGKAKLNGMALTGHTEAVRSVAVSEDSKTIVSGSGDMTLRVWNLQTGESKLGGKALKGHTQWVHSVAFASDGVTVASGSSDETIRLWDIKKGQSKLGGNSLKGHTGGVRSVAFSSDGKTIVSGSADHTVRLWDVQNFQVKLGGDALVGHTGAVNALLYSPDGKTIVSASEDNCLRLWDAGTGKMKLGGQALEGHSWPVTCMAFSPDGATIVSGSKDNTLRLWDAETGEAKLGGKALEGHTNGINSVAFSPDGKTIGSGSNDKTVRLWDAASGNKMLAGNALNGHLGAVCSVAFAPDGKKIASGSADFSIRLWDAQTGEPMLDGKALKEHWKPVLSLVFSPDGKTIVSGSADSTVCLWNAETGEVGLDGEALEGHDESVLSVAFSSNGNYFVSDSEDQTIRLWDTKTGKYKARANVLPTDEVNTSVVSSRERVLCPGGDPNTIGLKLDHVTTRVKGYCRSDGQWRLCAVLGNKTSLAFLETV